MSAQEAVAVDIQMDRDLVHLARSGDGSSLGYLLARHRGEMMAVALAILRRPTEAEDAVQDAMLVAVRRIEDLRDPGAVGPWLKMIVRNCCRMQLRAQQPVLVEDFAAVALPRGESDPAELLERHVTGDWVWHALEQLSPPLRLVTMLRYFTGMSGYEQISAVCGVPVGTVRSRLSAARAKLSQQLAGSPALGHGLGVAEAAAARGREAEQTLAAGPQGSFGQVLRDTWHPAVQTSWSDGRRTCGIRPIVEVMDNGIGVGVRQRLAGVVASREILIWEIDVLNPAAGAPHCPPRTAWVLFLDHGRVRHFRQYHEHTPQP